MIVFPKPNKTKKLGTFAYEKGEMKIYILQAFYVLFMCAFFRWKEEIPTKTNTQRHFLSAGISFSGKNRFFLKFSFIFRYFREFLFFIVAKFPPICYNVLLFALFNTHTSLLENCNASMCPVQPNGIDLKAYCFVLSSTDTHLPHTHTHSVHFIDILFP